MRPVLLGNIGFALLLLALIIVLGRMGIRAWVDRCLRNVSSKATQELTRVHGQIEAVANRIQFMQEQVGTNTDRINLVESDLNDMKESDS